jgi:addiction module HigA family antidote
MKKITRPGEILKEKYLEPLQLRPADLARATDMYPAVVGNILNGKQRITIPIGLRLSRFFKTPERYWTELQYQYDIAEIGKNPKFQAVLRKIKPAAVKKRA